MSKRTFKTYIHKVLRYYFISVAALIILLCVLSWILGIYIDGIEGILTERGLRWVFSNSIENFRSVPLAEMILGFIALSVLRESGIQHSYPFHNSLKQKRAFQITAICCVVFISIITLLLFLPSAILLSAFGTIENSPFIKGLFGTIVLLCVIAGNVYGYTSGRFVTLDDFIRAHTNIFSSITSYFILLFLSSQLMGCLQYTEIFAITGDNGIILHCFEFILYYIPLVFYLLLL